MSQGDGLPYLHCYNVSSPGKLVPSLGCGLVSASKPGPLVILRKR